MNEQEFQGRLNAHRELLIAILAAVMSGRTGDLAQTLRDEMTFKNGEEDPGIEPGDGYAVETRMADEMRAVVEAALARARA